MRDNLAFEDLAIAPSGDVFVAIEAALYQDGPAASIDEQAACARIIRYDGTTGEPKAAVCLSNLAYPTGGREG